MSEEGQNPNQDLNTGFDMYDTGSRRPFDCHANLTISFNRNKRVKIATDSMKAMYEDLMGKMDDDIAELQQSQRKMVERLGAVVKDFESVQDRARRNNTYLAIMQNSELSKHKSGSPFIKVPFLDGTYPEDYDDLVINPVSKGNVEDIVRKGTIKQYLKKYGVCYDESDNELTLKQHLYDFLNYL